MREIEFRSWNPRSGEMEHFDLDSYDRSSHDSYGNLERYTGLKVKGCVKLFGGDIIKFPSGTIKETNRGVDGNGLNYITYVNNEDNIGVVHDLGYAFFVGSKEVRDFYGILNHQRHLESYNIEVIGNIRQNPELLK